jgi:hypothetical protein
VAQRALHVLVRIVSLLVAMLTVVTQTVGAQPSPSRPVLLGILEPDGAHYAAERSLGIDVVTLQVGWDLVEPAPDHFDTTYVRSFLARVEAARAAGMSVVLDPGLQYAPDWVMDLDASSRFEDQYGDRFGGPAGSGNAVPNAVTDPLARDALASYLHWLGRRVPARLLYAVRAGGGPTGELRYPPADFDGHSDCYWAYDPDTQAASPVPGWRPGTGTAAEARDFIDAYNEDLATYSAWFSKQLSSSFPGVAQLLMLPGWGQRPGYVAAAVPTLLTQGSPELNLGTDWPLQLADAPYPQLTIAYTTWLDAPSAGATLQLEDPATYLASLATGFRTGGENTGGGGVANLRLGLARARTLGFSLVDWMQESQIFDPSAFRQEWPSSQPISQSAFIAAVHDFVAA